MTRTILTAVLLLATGLVAAAPTAFAAQPVDDSASQVLGGPLRMRWDTPVPVAGQRQGVSGEVWVQVRLNTSPWRGRQGRIYMTVSTPPSGPVTTAWTGRGRLLDGSVRSGERALVYAGTIDADTLEDTLRLLIRADGERLVRLEQLHYTFEIDLETP